MFQKVAIVARTKLTELTQHCHELKPLMTPDVSNYAKKRYRLWLFHEANLGKDKSIKTAHFDERLWRFCQRINPSSNIALLTFGGEFEDGKTSDARILYHRDDTYAQEYAYGVNFGGAAVFGINTDRQSSDPEAESIRHIELNDGDIYRFNCKHQHAVCSHDPGRFSLNIWTIKTDLKRYPGFALDPKIASLL